jgi:hypothetical protein
VTAIHVIMVQTAKMMVTILHASAKMDTMAIGVKTSLVHVTVIHVITGEDA